MRASTMWMVKGMFHEARGTARRMAGTMLSNRTLGAKGSIERLTGKMQRKFGKLEGMCGF